MQNADFRRLLLYLQLSGFRIDPSFEVLDIENYLPCFFRLTWRCHRNEKNGKSYFSYFIRGNVRGREVRVGVTPPDKGGYLVLDIVFGLADMAELVVKPFEMKDDATGRVITGNTYMVRSYDENGEVYECPIKPARASDKTLLNMLLR